MKGFLAAVGFLCSMQLVGAALISIGLYGVPAFQIEPSTARAVLGFWCVGAVIATGFIARSVLRRIDRRS